MYIYIYIHTYIYIYKHTHKYRHLIHVYIHVYKHKHIQVPNISCTTHTFKDKHTLKKITHTGIKYPVEGNLHGSYLTMLSKKGITFGIINIIGNFGTVFVDQAYWQGAIAARPSATYKGYLLGGIAWFAIPFTMATTLGLAGRALDLPITTAEASDGLVPPAVAVHLLGSGGAFLITFQLFMAVTASGSAEQIAVASLVCYDVYKRYIRPQASGPELILVSRVSIFAWGVLSGVLAILLNDMEIGLGWVYQAMGAVFRNMSFCMLACWFGANECVLFSYVDAMLLLHMQMCFLSRDFRMSANL
jgi:Na+/proline symporter